MADDAGAGRRPLNEPASTLAGEWADFVKHAVPAGCPEAAKTGLQAAFYSGAGAAFRLVMLGMKEGAFDTIALDVLHTGSIAAELVAFVRARDSGRTRG